jgi:hypothetical protein
MASSDREAVSERMKLDAVARFDRSSIDIDFCQTIGMDQGFQPRGATAAQYLQASTHIRRDKAGRNEFVAAGTAIECRNDGH